MLGSIVCFHAWSDPSSSATLACVKTSSSVFGLCSAYVMCCVVLYVHAILLNILQDLFNTVVLCDLN
jgi:hypothetical protein